MYEFTSMQEFCQHLFDRSELAGKSSAICEALLEAQSPRLSDLSHRMSGRACLRNRDRARRIAAQRTPTRLALGRSPAGVHGAATGADHGGVMIRGDAALGWQSLGFFAGALVVWLVDKNTGLLNRFGHDLWHVFTAVALVYMYLAV